MGALATRALSFGACIRAPDFENSHRYMVGFMYIFVYIYIHIYISLYIKRQALRPEFQGRLLPLLSLASPKKDVTSMLFKGFHTVGPF